MLEVRFVFCYTYIFDGFEFMLLTKLFKVGWKKALSGIKGYRLTGGQIVGRWSRMKQSDVFPKTLHLPTSILKIEL